MEAPNTYTSYMEAPQYIFPKYDYHFRARKECVGVRAGEELPAEGEVERVQEGVLRQAGAAAPHHQLCHSARGRCRRGGSRGGGYSQSGRIG